MENFPMRGSREMRPENRDQRGGIERLEGGGERVLRGEVDQHLDIQGRLSWIALHRRFLAELVAAIARWMTAGPIARVMDRSLAAGRRPCPSRTSRPARVRSRMSQST